MVHLLGTCMEATGIEAISHNRERRPLGNNVACCVINPYAGCWSLGKTRAARNRMLQAQTAHKVAPCLALPLDPPEAPLLQVARHANQTLGHGQWLEKQFTRTDPTTKSSAVGRMRSHMLQTVVTRRIKVECQAVRKAQTQACPFREKGENTGKE